MRLLLLITQDLLEKYDEKPQQIKYTSLSNYIEDLSKKHEVWIACDNAFPHILIYLRHYLSKILVSGHFLTFTLPFSENEYDSSQNYTKKIRQNILDYFVSQCSPDLLLSFLPHTSDNEKSDTCHIAFHRPAKHISELYIEKKRKPKLAYFSPIIPAKSGIASYSSELLPYLSRYYDIKLIIDQKEVIPVHGDITFPILSPEQFLIEAEQFDRILYHFGNSFYHSYMWPILKQYPGTVVLHDFYLSGLLSYEELSNGQETFWTTQLFKSHGYRALKARLGKDIAEVANRFPCNFEILQHSRGVIIHSDYSNTLAQQWYTMNPLRPWHTIPHLRIPAKKIDKENARKILGFPPNDLIICSFGLLNSTKLNHRLLHAFLNSILAEDPCCHLVYVGEFTCQEYAAELHEEIIASGLKDRITVTGWTDDTQFQSYLQAADIGVQLRSTSRGETSGTVLDCMNYGLATIVNANGSMASLPENSLIMLEDDFDNAVLIDVLEYLKEKPAFRQDLGKKAQNHIRTAHDPTLCAQRYRDAIETFHKQQEHYRGLLTTIARTELLPPQTDILQDISKAISISTLPNITQKQLLIDVSAIVQSDLRTGIQRVVRAQLLELINLVPSNIRVEPVYLSSEEGLHYRYARDFTFDILDIPLHTQEDIVQVRNGDIFYGLDFHWDGVIKADKEGIYTQWSAAGASINFVVYDLLPILYPEFFPEDATRLHHKWLETIVPVSDTLICISDAVSNNLRSWTSAYMPKVLNRDLNITTVHLGSDIVASAPSEGLPENAKELIHTIGEKPTFLMVGTIEPRKGYLQALSAFDTLWENGTDIHLVIIGKEGWTGLPSAQRRTIPQIIKRLKEHPQSGKKLFWFEEASDLFLETLYRQANALIAASEDEGFGLPLIEAAHYELPIIARDIPVFREVASDNAFYFPNNRDSSILADALIKWLEAYRENRHIPSANMPYISWKESAQCALHVLLSDKYEKDLKKETSTRDKSTEKPGERYLSPRAQEIYRMLLAEQTKGEKE